MNRVEKLGLHCYFQGYDQVWEKIDVLIVLTYKTRLVLNYLFFLLFFSRGGGNYCYLRRSSIFGNILLPSNTYVTLDSVSLTLITVIHVKKRKRINSFALPVFTPCLVTSISTCSFHLYVFYWLLGSSTDSSLPVMRCWPRAPYV